MMHKQMDKRGQVAIFVIVAIVIAAVIIVIFMYPRLSNIVAPSELNPTQYLSDCIAPNVKSTIELLAKQGGDENPEGFINYLGTKVKYLCYTTGYYKTCVVQQPLLVTHFGEEISRILGTRLDQCARNLKAEYEKRGYTVSLESVKSSVTMAPGKVQINYVTPMKVTKDGETRTFDKFDVSVESQIYDLLSLATSIVDYEVTYGDSETTTYMQYYPDLKIEKIRLEDGVKIYKLTNVVTKEEFTFATRSLVWPPGYGLV
jgi:hypothetical protein